MQLNTPQSGPVAALKKKPHPFFNLPVAFVFSEPFHPQCRVVDGNALAKRTATLFLKGKATEAVDLALAMTRALIAPNPVRREQVQLAIERGNEQQ